MRSLRNQILVLLLGSLVILAASFVMVLGWYLEDRASAEATIKVQKDLTICSELFDTKYPGSWLVRDGELYKGTLKISLNNDIVDDLAQLTGDTVTIFLGDTRAATTVRGSNGERAIGTKVSENVAETVLENGQTYVGEANVVGGKYQTAYAPIRAENGVIIGMFYVGISHAFEDAIIKRCLINIAEFELVLTIIMGGIAWWLLGRLINYSSAGIIWGTRQAVPGEEAQLSSDSQDAENERPDDIFQREWDNSNLANPIIKSDLNTVPGQSKGDEGEELLNTSWYNGSEMLPKGLNKTTLDQIIKFIQVNHRPLSTEEVAEGVQRTRVTVRRYLEFLEQNGLLKSDQKCGPVGRPVKIFIPL